MPDIKEYSSAMSIDSATGKVMPKTEVANASARKATAVTPNDTTNLSGGATKGLYVGVTGNVVVTMADGTDATFTNLSSGAIHPISVLKVKATGTTATNILAVY
jgi:hypothetical protein